MGKYSVVVSGVREGSQACEISVKIGAVIGHGSSGRNNGRSDRNGGRGSRDGGRGSRDGGRGGRNGYRRGPTGGRGGPAGGKGIRTGGRGGHTGRPIGGRQGRRGDGDGHNGGGVGRNVGRNGRRVNGNDGGGGLNDGGRITKKEKRRCWNCKKRGHVGKNCPSLPDKTTKQSDKEYLLQLQASLERRHGPDVRTKTKSHTDLIRL